MPALRFIRPCAPVAGKTVPKGGDWLHELKLDGYHFQVVKDGRQVRLYSRGGTEWTKRLPAFADTFRRLPCRSAILDGELVLPDADGAPDFDGLHAAVRSAADVELNFFAFDLLHCDGTDLLRFPLIERKLRLARLVGRGGIECMHLVQIFDDGVKLLEAAERMQLGGHRVEATNGTLPIRRMPRLA